MPALGSGMIASSFTGIMRCIAQLLRSSPHDIPWLPIERWQLGGLLYNDARRLTCHSLWLISPSGSIAFTSCHPLEHLAQLGDFSDFHPVVKTAMPHVGRFVNSHLLKFFY